MKQVITLHMHTMHSHWEIIMSTVGGYHHCIRGCLAHQKDVVRSLVGGGGEYLINAGKVIYKIFNVI